MKRWIAIAAVFAALAGACAVDTAFREYLTASFWLPFYKYASSQPPGKPRWMTAPFAGMGPPEAHGPLQNLRNMYQGIALAGEHTVDVDAYRAAAGTARAVPTLLPRDREEIDLIEAKACMRAGSPGNPAPLRDAKAKFQKFLQTAKSPDLLSEARGWLARTHYLLGEHSAAGKLYFDEFRAPESNLSAEVLANSLSIVYSGAEAKVAEQLEDYFDTPEHAAFAIELITNPPGRDGYLPETDVPPAAPPAIPYQRITSLLEKHTHLFRTPAGASALALLGMRVALRAADPRAAIRIAARVPARSPVRNEPDFAWMLASAHYVSRDYQGAEAPLKRLFASDKASRLQRAAAAYGLAGVYQKTGNRVEQIRSALWLNQSLSPNGPTLEPYVSVYWANSGFDLGYVLDAEASIADLREFLTTYPKDPQIRIIKYSLAVHLARAGKYEEAAALYDETRTPRRAARMRELARLQANAATPEGRYDLAAYMAANPERLLFNDTLWSGFQGYALIASTDARLTAAERTRLMTLDRNLRDAQEERWQAYLILRDVIRQAGPGETADRAARLAIGTLRRINPRFEREKEIRAAGIELSRMLRGRPNPVTTPNAPGTTSR